MTRRLVFVLITILLLVSGCTSPTPDSVESKRTTERVQGTGRIVIRDAWMRPALHNSNGAIYFVIFNGAEKYDEILRVSTPAAEAAEIHVSRMGGDVMSMHHVAFVPLATAEEVTFAPGGLHVMLVGLKRDVKTGDEITVTLHFKNHDAVTIAVPVRETQIDLAEESLQRLSDARQKWLKANISHYRFRLNIQCVCPASQDAPKIEVQNGEIVSIDISEGSDIDEHTLQEYSDIGTIDRFFDFVEDNLGGGTSDTFSVKYDETYGFPLFYRDSDIETIDDESKMFVSEFEILP